jgi:hypothetical protein
MQRSSQPAQLNDRLLGLENVCRIAFAYSPQLSMEASQRDSMVHELKPERMSFQGAIIS